MRGETIFATREKQEEDLAEDALRAAGIDFEIHLDAIDDSGNVCHLSTVYDVNPDDATRAREALKNAGLVVIG